MYLGSPAAWADKTVVWGGPEDGLARLPMTPTQFRRIALSLPEAEERQHMGHPDFRVCGKIFATMSYPDKSWAMVKLSRVEQARFYEAEPDVFVPIDGVWGRRGATHVRLQAATQESVRRALTAAWRNAAPKHLVPRPEASKRS